MNYFFNMIDRILNLVYPIKCVECGKISERYLCNKCKARLNIRSKVHVNYYKNRQFKKHIYLFKYDGWIRDKIIKYKFRDKTYLYKFFSELIMDANQRKNFLDKYDYIVPVPVSKRRYKKRGYNQSELIGKQIAKQKENIKISKIIIKTIDNKVQSTLNQKERAENVKGVYMIDNTKKDDLEDMLKDKKVLIIDDIYTTGSTVNECAKVLKEVGLKDIDVFTIAKD